MGPANPASRDMTSDLEQLDFLVFDQLVNVGYVLVGQVLELLLRAANLILARLTVLDQPLQLLLGLAPDVANGDLGLLALVPGHLDHVASALLGHLRQDDADLRSLILAAATEVRVAEPLFPTPSL